MAAETVSRVERVVANREPRSLAAARRGVSDDAEMQELLSDVICDALEGLINVGTGNLVVNACGKKIKLNEQRLRYGVQLHEGGPRRLAFKDDAPPANGHGKAKKK